MEKSILKSTRKVLGLHPTDVSFDDDLLIHINATFSTLQQLGVGPLGGFMIEDETTLWDEFPVSMVLLNQVKLYMFLAIKIIFDPAASPHAQKALEEQLAEKGWRLQVQSEDEQYGVDQPTTVVLNGGTP